VLVAGADDEGPRRVDDGAPARPGDREAAAQRDHHQVGVGALGPPAGAVVAVAGDVPRSGEQRARDEARHQRAAFSISSASPATSAASARMARLTRAISASASSQRRASMASVTPGSVAAA